MHWQISYINKIIFSLIPAPISEINKSRRQFLFIFIWQS